MPGVGGLGRSVERSLRRRAYNIALVSISITVALVVGTVGLCSVLVDSLGASWAPAPLIAGTDLDVFSFVIVAVLLLAWAVSWAMSRRRGVSLG